MSSARAISTSRRVVAMSQPLGRHAPEGWLWARMMPAASRRSASPSSARIRKVSELGVPMPQGASPSHALPASGPIGHLLLFGNPTAASAKKEQMFAGEGEDQQRVHRVWRVLRQAGLVPPGVANESRALNEYFSFPPASSQRLGLSSFVSLPSPSSGERYVGVAGVLRLFGAADFRQLLELEGDWLTSHVFPRIDNAGRVLVFQAHAWRFLSSAEPRTLRGLELRKMPPTRHIFSTRAVAELQELADIGCHL